IAHAGTPAEVLRPEILTAAYGTPVAVTPHPVTGTPVVLPVPGSGR
ncbi:MAG: hemin ABC transporter ATP-binding protein, partial [Candidatus Brocadiae bacterium]|nr:hemin ABC transporter ATP-binding protein [Candidatus Brocadiia bacterium]